MICLISTNQSTRNATSTPIQHLNYHYILKSSSIVSNCIYNKSPVKWRKLFCASGYLLIGKVYCGSNSSFCLKTTITHRNIFWLHCITTCNSFHKVQIQCFPFIVQCIIITWNEIWKEANISNNLPIQSVIGILDSIATCSFKDFVTISFQCIWGYDIPKAKIQRKGININI